MQLNYGDSPVIALEACPDHLLSETVIFDTGPEMSRPKGSGGADPAMLAVLGVRRGWHPQVAGSPGASA